MQEKIPMIPINIWDDDDYVPDGEIQETYAYVETDDISTFDKFRCLEIVRDYILDNEILDGVGITLFWHDTKNDYKPETIKRVIADYGEKFLWKRWELKFKHISHKKLEKLVDILNNAQLKYDENKIYFYSES